MKKIFLPLLFFLFALTLTACGGPKVVDEARMMEDLSQQFQMYPETGHYCSIDTLEIEKRQTNLEDKEDFVYIWITGADNEVTCRIGLRLTYVLYNDGWLLEQIEHYKPDEWQYTPLEGPTQEHFYYYLENNCSNLDGVLEIGDVSTNLDGLTASCTASLTFHYNYMTDTDIYIMQAYFDPNSGYWNVDNAMQSSTRDWFVNGVWTLQVGGGLTGKHYVTLTVFETSGNTIDCQYSMDFEEYTFGTSSTTSYFDEGIFTVSTQPRTIIGNHNNYEIECGAKKMTFYLNPDTGINYEAHKSTAIGVTAMVPATPVTD